MKITLNNLPESITQSDILNVAGEFGKVVHVMIVKDVKTEKPTGIAYVEMGTRAEGEAAVAGLEGKEIAGNKIQAKETTEESLAGHGKNPFKGGNTHGAMKGTSGSKFGGPGKAGRVLKGGGGAQRGR